MGCQKLDTSAFGSIIDSMFKKLLDYFGISDLKKSWNKLLIKSNEIGQEYIDYEYEDQYMKQLQKAMDHKINNREENKDGNLE